MTTDSKAVCGDWAEQVARTAMGRHAVDVVALDEVASQLRAAEHRGYTTGHKAGDDFRSAALASTAGDGAGNWQPLSLLAPQTNAMLGRWCRCGDREDGSERWYWQQAFGRYFDFQGERHWCLDGHKFEAGPFYGETPTHFYAVASAPSRQSPAVPASPRSGSDLECENCGSREDLDAIQARGFRSCCPERSMKSSPAPAEHGAEKRDWRDRALTNAERLTVFASYHSDKLGQALRDELLEFAAEWQDEVEASSQGRSERAVEIRELSEKATQGPWHVDMFPYRDMETGEPQPPQCEGICTHDEAEGLAESVATCGERDAKFMVALVNAYRDGQLVHVSALSQGGQAGGSDLAQSPSTSEREG